MSEALSNSAKGILVCGLNGAGKSTLGRALAERIGYRFVDIEDLYFPEKDPDYLYASPRTQDEVEAMLRAEVNKDEPFVLASVRCDFAEDIVSALSHIILIELPREVRLQRVRSRSFGKFGSRMLPGGDLYEREESFFRFAEARSEALVREWLLSAGREAFVVDGLRPVAENVDIAAAYIINKTI